MLEVVVGLVLCKLLGEMGLLGLAAGFVLGVMATRAYPTATTRVTTAVCQFGAQAHQRLTTELRRLADTEAATGPPPDN